MHFSCFVLMHCNAEGVIFEHYNYFINGFTIIELSCSESLMPLLVGCTSSAISVADSDVSMASSEVFTPCSNWLRPTWRSLVWDFYSVLENINMLSLIHVKINLSRW